MTGEVMPGFCLCFGPGMNPDHDVRYTLRASSFFQANNSNVQAGGLRDDHGRPTQRDPFSDGHPPFGKIDFFMEPSFGTMSAGGSGQPITGFLANGDYTSRSGRSDAHRHGRGRYMVTSTEIVNRIAGALRAGSPVPGAQNLGSEFSDLIGRLPNGSTYSDWFTNLYAALRGSTNLVAIGYLHFPPAR